MSCDKPEPEKEDRTLGPFTHTRGMGEALTAEAFATTTSFATLLGDIDGIISVDVVKRSPLRPMWYRVWMLGGCKDLLLQLQEKPPAPQMDMVDQIWIVHNALLEAFLAVHLRALGDFLAGKTGPFNTDLVAEDFVLDVKKWKAHDVTKRWHRDWPKLHKRISKWATHLTPAWRDSPQKAEWDVQELSRNVGSVLKVFLNHLRDDALPRSGLPGFVELVQRLTRRGT